MTRLYGYKPSIKAACGCPDEDTAAIEGIMRDRNGGVLDSLTPGDFNREAILCFAMLAEIRDVAPDLVPYFERQGA